MHVENVNNNHYYWFLTVNNHDWFWHAERVASWSGAGCSSVGILSSGGGGGGARASGCRGGGVVS